MPEQYFKVLNADLTSYHGGTGKWTVGRWRSVRGHLVPCQNGLHFVRLDQLVRWLGPAICPFEPSQQTEIIIERSKLVCRRGRITAGPLEGWNERAARLFAADCAEHVLSNFESTFPSDNRPRKAIAAARQFANGAIDRDVLSAAGRDARYAASLACSSAVFDAAECAAECARYTSFNAACSVAGIAENSAGSAGTERTWQTQRLAHYLGIEVPT